MNDAIFFPAELRQVELSHDTLDLEPIDCELLEQMSMAVFRKLDLKVTSQSLVVRSARALAHQAVAHRGSPAAGRLPDARQEKKKVEGSISIP